MLARMDAKMNNTLTRLSTTEAAAQNPVKVQLQALAPIEPGLSRRLSGTRLLP
jgi:hypothetical protein